jgi:hypothetical protein
MTTMTDAQIRLACLDAAVRTQGNPNYVQTAREYYSFVTEHTQAAKTPEPVAPTEEAPETPSASQQLRVQKAARK